MKKLFTNHESSYIRKRFNENPWYYQKITIEESSHYIFKTEKVHAESKRDLLISPFTCKDFIKVYNL